MHTLNACMEDGMQFGYACMQQFMHIQYALHAYINDVFYHNLSKTLMVLIFIRLIDVGKIFVAKK